MRRRIEKSKEHQHGESSGTPTERVGEKFIQTNKKPKGTTEKNKIKDINRESSGPLMERAGGEEGPKKAEIGGGEGEGGEGEIHTFAHV